jgi:hypothetical protein
MSKEAVETVIGRAILEPKFRDLLMADPDGALAGLDLTENEKAGLKSLDSETLDSMSHTFEVRTSKTKLF